MNYFKIAWRNLTRNKAYSFINIAGLAAGLTCFLLISLYVLDELSYDKYNEKYARIYRIDTDITIGGSSMSIASASDPMGETLKREYPEVEATTRFHANYTRLVKKGNEFLSEPNVVRADSTLFDVFTLPLLSGDPKNALTRPQSVVISESMAKKYFGTTDALGKTIEIKERDNHLFNVTGVMKDIPSQSHFHFDFIMSMHNVDYQFGNFLSHNFNTYVVLKKGADPKRFDGYFKQVMTKYVLPQAKEFMQINSMEDFEKAGNKLHTFLTPLSSIHLYSDKAAELSPNSSIQYVYIFSGVAIFILLIACINFMNLSTARSTNRSREVGIRKVLGTGRNSLISQFLVESIITAIIAMIIAIVIAAAVLPVFNDIAARQLTISSMFTPQIIAILIFLPVVSGIAAGSYPAFFLSSFKPIAVLKSKLNTGSAKSSFRNVLVVFQFAVSVTLIIGTITIYRQLNFIQSKKIGFDRDQVLVINNTSATGENVAKVFKEEALKIGGVKSATIAGYLPVENSARSDNTYSTDVVMNANNAINMQTWRVDYDYLNTLGMKLVEGRGFSKEFGTDSTGIVINQTAAKILGIKDPVGKFIYSGDRNTDNRRAYKIIGIVENFNYQSMRSNIGPLCFMLGDANWQVALKIAGKNTSSVISQVEKKFKALYAGIPFEYKFLDESFDQMYRAEQRAGRIALIFAALTVMIACLGLFGLATYMAEQRKKEIGVRKVLGASVNSLVNLLSKDFLRLVIISLAVAVPCSWLLMHKWLENFAFRIEIGWVVFLVAGVATIAIAMFTTSFQAIKAALANPVKSLRSE